MEEFALLGNAAAVPIIIGITQLLKKNFSFKYKADVVSAVVALIVCPLWWFYNTPEAVIRDALDDGTVKTIKFGMQLLMISAATWLSATKSYDLFSGNKKRTAEGAAQKKALEDLHLSERNRLLARIKELETSAGGRVTNEPEDDNEISDKLLDILEGRA